MTRLSNLSHKRQQTEISIFHFSLFISITMRWFEPNLQKLLKEAGTEGLRISHIVRNICNMEPLLFGNEHPYEDAWKEIYYFLRAENKKADSPYRYVKGKRGYFYLDCSKMTEEVQMTINF